MNNAMRRLTDDGISMIPSIPGSDLIGVQLVSQFLNMIEARPQGAVSYAREGEDEHDLGLITRSGETVRDGDGTYDKKTFWHYTPGMEDTFREQNGLFFRRWHTFFADCAQLFAACERVVSDATAELDDIMPGYQLHHHFTGDRTRELHTLRFLAYQSCRSDGGELARAHYDRSGLTLALHESAPGLQYQDCAGIWSPTGSTRDETLIFPGRKLEQMTDRKVPALFHRVMPHKDQRPVRPGIIRVAVVFFAHPFGVDLALSTHER